MAITNVDFLRVGVGGSNYLQVDFYGELSLVGKATVWDDLRVPLTQSLLGVLAKPDFDETNLGYLFPASDTSEICFLILQMPHSWKEGSTIYPHVHFQANSGSSIVFKIDYKWYNLGDAVPAGWTTLALTEPEFTWSSGNLSQLQGSASGIDGTGKTASSLLLVKLYRDDAVAGDILTWDFDIHYEIDKLGTQVAP